MNGATTRVAADLGAPLELVRGPSWPNRLALSPLTNQLSNVDGTVHADELEWLASRASSGFGMVMTSAAHVSRAGHTFPGQLGAWDDRFIEGLHRIATVVRESGARSILQLHHGGQRAHAELAGEPLVGPRDDPASGARALTTRQIGGVIADFVAAAERAQSAGFDGVEMHGAHGYLIGQFLDQRNDRRDGFGGSLGDRSRLCREIVDGIRSATGDSFQVGLRLTAERHEHGILLAETREVAADAMASGHLDFLDMSLWDAFARPVGQDASERTLLDRVVDIPRHGVRLAVSGGIVSGAAASACLESGADVVLVGRAAIRDQRFATKAMGEPAFVAASGPMTREGLHRQGVGDAFVDYLNGEFDGFVV